MNKIRYLALAPFTLASVLVWSLPASAREESARATVVTVAAGKPTEFRFKLSTTTIKSGTVTFKVTNNGSLPHDFKVCARPTAGTADTCSGKATKLLTPGSSATLTVTFAKSGTLRVSVHRYRSRCRRHERQPESCARWLCNDTDELHREAECLPGTATATRRAGLRVGDLHGHFVGENADMETDVRAPDRRRDGRAHPSRRKGQERSGTCPPLRPLQVPRARHCQDQRNHDQGNGERQGVRERPHEKESSW